MSRYAGTAVELRERAVHARDLARQNAHDPITSANLRSYADELDWEADKLPAQGAQDVRYFGLEPARGCAIENTADAAQTYRRTAAEMRRRATEMKDAPSKAVMLSAAQSYDYLVDVIENPNEMLPIY
jgi:hypothetical protein